MSTTNNLARVLIVVAKRPAPGRTKTRLTPPLSAAQAAGLYECFLLDTLEVMRQAPAVRQVIAYLPSGEQAYFASLAPDFELYEQTGPDLGARLDHALIRYLQPESGASRRSAVIMASDSPTLPASRLDAAFEALDNGANVVIGPTQDGGYYLIGMQRPHPALLREVRMSTSHVTADTLALAARENLQTALLPAWYDVDDLASLRRLDAELKANPHSADSPARHTRRYLAQPALRELLEASPAALHSPSSSPNPTSG